MIIAIVAICGAVMARNLTWHRTRPDIRWERIHGRARWERPDHQRWRERRRAAELGALEASEPPRWLAPAEVEIEIDEVVPAPEPAKLEGVRMDGETVGGVFGGGGLLHWLGLAAVAVAVVLLVWPWLRAALLRLPWFAAGGGGAGIVKAVDRLDGLAAYQLLAQIRTMPQVAADPQALESLDYLRGVVTAWPVETKP